MKLNVTSIVLFLLVFGAVSCKENTALEYENDPALYFENTTYGQRDSVSHTFFVNPDTQIRDTVFVEILTMGYPVDEERPFVLIQANEGQPGAAIAGKHFVAFDDPEMTAHLKMPKGAVRKSFPLIVLRDPSLETEEVRIELKIGENDFFRSGIDVWNNFVVKTTAMAVKPTTWDTYWKYTFGLTWGSVKMKFIIDNTGFSDFDGGYLSSDYADYLGSKVQQKLLEYNADPTNLDRPLKEADGTIVTFE